MATFGGDEVGAVVIDFGCQSVRVGFAGEDTPYHIIPANVAFNTEPAADEAAVAPSGSSDVTEAKDASAGDGVAMEVDGAAAAPPPTDNASDNAAEDPRVPPKNVKGHKPCSAMAPVRDTFEIRPLIEDRMVADWDALEVMLDHIFDNELRTSPEEHPLLLTEPSWNTTANRERMCTLAFEKYKVPAFYVAKQAVCTSFSTARPTSLVVDVSESGTSVVPVYDGYVLSSGIVRSRIGGRALRSMYKEVLANDFKIKLVPTYQVQTKKQVKEGENARFTKRTSRFPVSPVFHEMAVDSIVENFMTQVSKVAPQPYEDNVLAQVPYEDFEFPTGYHKGFGSERFRVAEALFNPQQFAAEALRGSGDSAAKGVVDMIVSSIQQCDTDVRQTLYSNIVITGGMSLTTGFVERLNSELEVQALAGGRFKVHAPVSVVERRHANWIGGSILGSLGTFQQMWISAKEFEETGCSVVGTKCS